MTSKTRATVLFCLTLGVPGLAAWATVKDWKEISRYDVTIDKRKADDLYKASGIVLKWLKPHW